MFFAGFWQFLLMGWLTITSGSLALLCSERICLIAFGICKRRICRNVPLGMMLGGFVCRECDHDQPTCVRDSWHMLELNLVCARRFGWSREILEPIWNIYIYVYIDRGFERIQIDGMTSPDTRTLRNYKLIKTFYKSKIAWSCRSCTEKVSYLPNLSTRPSHRWATPLGVSRWGSFDCTWHLLGGRTLRKLGGQSFIYCSTTSHQQVPGKLELAPGGDFLSILMRDRIQIEEKGKSLLIGFITLGV